MSENRLRSYGVLLQANHQISLGKHDWRSATSPGASILRSVEAALCRLSELAMTSAVFAPPYHSQIWGTHLPKPRSAWFKCIEQPLPDALRMTLVIGRAEDRPQVEGRTLRQRPSTCLA